MTREDLKKLIKESIDEVFVEIGENYDGPSDPLEAGEDHFADNLEDYKDSLRHALATLKTDEEDYDVKVDRKAFDCIYKHLSKIICQHKDVWVLCEICNPPKIKCESNDIVLK